MSPDAHDTSSYLRHLKRGKALAESSHSLPEARVAVLANFSTQQFVHLLRASFFDAGFAAKIFAAEYDTAALEVFNSESELFVFKPVFAVLAVAMQNYRERFFLCRTPEERDTLPERYSREIFEMARILREKGILTAVTNLALPIERMFGNFGIMTRHSLYGSVLEVNSLFQKAAREARCSVIDVMYQSARYGGDTFLDEKLWLSSKYVCANRFLPSLTNSVAENYASQKGKVKKCLVLDLDNTLWGGVIGDDGLDGIRLGHGDAFGESFQLFQHYILSLKHRGFILAVCSKNNDDTARSAFQKHQEMILREEDIAVFVANWNDKATNIQFIADTLNIGLDSLIFIDDSPFERNLVRSLLPTVSVPEMPEEVSEYIAALEASGLLETGSYSKDDFGRNQMYREEALRATEEMKFRNIDEYLQSLEIRVRCGPFTPDELPRVAQLLQRSNQFNLRTQRFDEAACETFSKAPGKYFTFQARLRDRFGDYGLIAIVCGEQRADVLFVTELVMSCRVLKRGMEEFMIDKLFEYCREHQLRGVQGEYIRTAKNAMVKEFYPSFGFSAVSGDEERQNWFLASADYAPRKFFIIEE